MTISETRTAAGLPVTPVWETWMEAVRSQNKSSAANFYSFRANSQQKLSCESEWIKNMKAVLLFWNATQFVVPDQDTPRSTSSWHITHFHHVYRCGFKALNLRDCHPFIIFGPASLQKMTIINTVASCVASRSGTMVPDRSLHSSHSQTNKYNQSSRKELWGERKSGLKIPPCAFLGMICV